jgi:hypothetical protein
VESLIFLLQKGSKALLLVESFIFLLQSAPNINTFNITNFSLFKTLIHVEH